MRAFLLALVAMVGCKQPVSYEPEHITPVALELTLADLSVRQATLELALPDGYRQESPGVHDATFSKPRDKLFFHVVRLSPIDDLGLHDPQPCGRPPEQGMSRLLHERISDRDELELCEARDQEGRPMRYWVRRSVLVEDNWIECLGLMHGAETKRLPDASHYTEKQREQVLAVCRSMRVVSLGPRIPIDQQGRQVR